MVVQLLQKKLEDLLQRSLPPEEVQQQQRETRKQAVNTCEIESSPCIHDLNWYVKHFTAGNIKNHFLTWKSITSNDFILNIVKNGLTIDFVDIAIAPHPHIRTFSDQEVTIIDNEISQLLSKNVITQVEWSEDNFVSGVFTVDKKDGGFRMILNLKQLNESVKYQHFKMETLDDVLNLLKPNVWMGSIDLKDAYYSIPIHPDFQKYFTFFWKHIYYQFVALPNGFGPAVRAFTKTLKVPFKVLRAKRHISVVYIDDSYLQGDSYNSCQDNINDTVSLLLSLGFTIHPIKSVLIPTQELTFLGFVINSRNMTIALTLKRSESLVNLCKELINANLVSIRFLARVIGTLVSCFPAVSHGPLHYRSLERDKITALKFNYGNFNAKMSLNDSSKEELAWWISQENKFSKCIHPPPIDLVLFSDASLEGWGGTDTKSDIGGRWSDAESPEHINALELTAAFLTLKSFCRTGQFRHVQLKVDNTTALSYINKMGGTHSVSCNTISYDMWQWSIKRGIWLSACHVPGVLNVTADKKSRHFADHIEWSLCSDAFTQICNTFGTPKTDIFASRLNAKLDNYFSWNPDPEAVAIDALAQDWSELVLYAFPPFNLIGKVLAKLHKDQASGVVMVPFWSTQPWFPQAIGMLTKPPLLCSPSYRLLELPGTFRKHPLHKKLYMLAMYLSGNHSETQTFQTKLVTSSLLPGDRGHKNSMMVQSDDGYNIVLGKKLIPIVQM